MWSTRLGRLELPSGTVVDHLDNIGHFQMVTLAIIHGSTALLQLGMDLVHHKVTVVVQNLVALGYPLSDPVLTTLPDIYGKTEGQGSEVRKVRLPIDNQRSKKCDSTYGRQGQGCWSAGNPSC